MTGNDDTDRQAAEYVLGLMPKAELRSFEKRLRKDAELRKLVERWEQTLAPLSEDGPRLKPPEGLWDRIQAAIDSEPPAQAPDAAFEGLFHFVRANEGDWIALSEGVDKKVLLTDPSGTWETYLLRIQPGHKVPAHDHDRLEECLIVEGELHVGEFRFFAGDFHAIGKGTTHPDLMSDVGAVVLIRGEIRHPIV